MSLRVEADTPEQQQDQVCTDLGQVAYWATSAYLSKGQQRHLDEARNNALQPNLRRPAIDRARVDEAVRHGLASTGGRGRGKVTLEDAHENGMFTALFVMSDCQKGIL